MIPAFIVLIVVAVALGAYIVIDIVREKKKAKAADTDKTEETAAESVSKETLEEAAPAVAEAQTVETSESEDGEVTKTVAVTENGVTRYIIIKYSKSFLAKLIQSDDETKYYYSQLKNRLLSYKGVKSRISWKWETFRLGRKTLAKLRLRGKTLSLCLALNADDYADTKYKVESLAEIKAYEDTPCMYRVKNDRRLKYSQDLIAAVMAQNGVQEQPIEEINYAAQYPYETTEALLERKLIKELTDEEAQSGTAFKPSGAAKTTQVVETKESEDGEVTKTVAVTENGETRYIIIKYSKSFLAKIIQSDDENKDYYSRVKNCLLSYKGVKNRISWKWETFRLGRKTVAKLRMRGKTLSLCLALNPEDYADTKYKVESLAEVKAYEDTPCMYRIKNDRRLKYSQDLITAVMAQNGVQEQPIEEINYAAQYPYETTEALLERKLIKELTDEEAQSGTTFRRSVTAQEVDNLMQDDIAVTLIRKSDGKSDKTKTGIVNVDTLSQHFKSGEKVTLDEIKKRVKGFNKKTTYIKVLARGTLDKNLTVEADNFSLQAVKMIVLTGGTAIKK